MDKSVQLWNVKKNFKMKKIFTGHKDHIYAVTILPNNRIVSASYDSTVILWNHNGTIRKQYKHNKKLKYIAHNDKYIAVSGTGKFILLFDHNLKLKKTLTPKTKPSGLAFSPNGRWMVAGRASTPNRVNIFDTRHDFKIHSYFTRHTNLTMAVAFIDNKTIISGGGKNSDIYVWKITGKQKAHLVGAGRRVWSVGMNENGIAWGNTWGGNMYKHNTPLEHFFDLNNFIVTPAKSQKNINRMQTKQQGIQLSHRLGGKYGYKSSILVIKDMNTEVAKVQRTSSSGYKHNTYGFTEDGTIISGGMNGKLYAYNDMGKTVATFIGHTGEVWDIATDGKWLVSGSDDQKVLLWNLDEIIHDSKSNNIYPTLSLFVDNQNEWVAWTRKGYYAASSQGDQYVGFHINRGYNNSADFVPASQFHKSLFKPSVVMNVFNTGSEKKAITKAIKKKHFEEVDTNELLPPRIILSKPKSRNIKTSEDQLELYFCIIPEGTSPITGIDLLLNGRPIKERGVRIKNRTSKVCLDKNVHLMSGQKHQTITIMARNKHAMSNPVVIEVEKKTAKLKDIFKPDLYILAIGISNYKNQDLKLDVAHKDAQAVSDVLHAQKDLFRHVNKKVLLNEEATKDNILDALDWLDQKATQRDVAIVFIAGHGMNDSRGSYYFLSHETNPKKLRRSAVKWLDFQDVITNLPGKVLLLADTCHSGNITGSKQRSYLGVADITSAIKSITAAGTGQVIMTAATGNSYSYEDESWGHGAFSKALIEGIKGKADYDNNHIINIKELDLYVTSRVKILTDGRQKPTTIIPNSVPDFAIGIH